MSSSLIGCTSNGDVASSPRTSYVCGFFVIALDPEDYSLNLSIEELL